ncbi:hypothetical protein [Xanthomonas fragariae]|uniref:hypothetical protein n=1 Tax=Xanthomonas fragariae TaxID=48664 RepID=UPI000A35C684|nr:hypothetical protein [Xanthomonas fragariae]WIY71243.1 hypothetical protein OW158_11875 [Xanthomonas fragariae]SMQ95688.1 hypothetical protein NBC2815_02354 [Xanthomonas fragariae]
MEADFFIFPRIVIMRTRIANKPSVAFVRASLSTQANLPLEAWLGRGAMPTLPTWLTIKASRHKQPYGRWGRAHGVRRTGMVNIAGYSTVVDVTRQMFTCDHLPTHAPPGASWPAPSG